MPPSQPSAAAWVAVADAAGQSYPDRDEALRDAQAVARGLVALAGSDPDALRRVVGTDDALRVMRLAGLSDSAGAAELSERQAAQQRQAAQARQRADEIWQRSGDPTYHPEYLAKMRAGASMYELGMLARALETEYQQTRPPTTAERYAAMRRQHDRATAESQRRSRPRQDAGRSPLPESWPGPPGGTDPTPARQGQPPATPEVPRA